MDWYLIGYLETSYLYRKNCLWERLWSYVIFLSWGMMQPDCFGGQGSSSFPVVVWHWCVLLCDIDVCPGVTLMCALVWHWCVLVLQKLLAAPCRTCPVSHWRALSAQCCGFKRLHSIFLGETEGEIQAFISSTWVLVGSWVCWVAFIHKTNETANKLVPLLRLGDS